MKLDEAVKPISYLKAHASEIVRESVERQRTFVITHNGEAKVVVQDIVSYQRTQESLALLKMLAQSQASIREGRAKPLNRAFTDLKARIAELP